MKIGYARVSTLDQNLDIQLEALKSAGCEKIFSEKVSGASDDRPALKELMNYVRDENDTVIVLKLDRLGRNVLDTLRILDELSSKGVKFKSIDEPMIDTTNKDNGMYAKLITAMLSIFAEMERNRILERTNAGRLRARKNGVSFGRPKVLSPGKAKHIVKLKLMGERPADIARTFGVSESTIRRV